MRNAPYRTDATCRQIFLAKPTLHDHDVAWVRVCLEQAAAYDHLPISICYAMQDALPGLFLQSRRHPLDPALQPSDLFAIQVVHDQQTFCHKTRHAAWDLNLFLKTLQGDKR